MAFAKGRWAGLCVPLVFLWAGCGKVDGRSGPYAGMHYCQDLAARYHFKVFVPPWKHRKEYRCEQGDFRNCTRWAPTGRYVFVVSDSPFVNFDSEIIVSLTVETLQGQALTHVQARINEVNSDPEAELIPASSEQDYRIMETLAGASVYDLMWRQKRTFESNTYKWYRRDAYVQVSSTVYHLEFFSILSLAHPEFDALVKSFDTGPAEDGAPRCTCMDEHAQPVTECN